MVGPKLRTFLTLDRLELSDAFKSEVLVVLPAIARGNLIGQVLLQIRCVTTDYDWPAFVQFDDKRHMARGMAGGADGVYTWRNQVVPGLEAPGVLLQDFVRKDAFVITRGERFNLCSVDMDIAARNLMQAAGMIEVQVPKHHDVDVLRREPQP
jgi:hypothetical protein